MWLSRSRVLNLTDQSLKNKSYLHDNRLKITYVSHLNFGGLRTIRDTSQMIRRLATISAMTELCIPDTWLIVCLRQKPALRERAASSYHKTDMRVHSSHDNKLHVYVDSESGAHTAKQTRLSAHTFATPLAPPLPTRSRP